MGTLRERRYHNREMIIEEKKSQRTSKIKEHLNS